MSSSLLSVHVALCTYFHGACSSFQYAEFVNEQSVVLESLMESKRVVMENTNVLNPLYQI